MELFKLMGSVFVDNEKANKSIRETDSLASKVGKGFQNMGSLAVSAGKVVATGVGAVATAMGGVVANTLESISTIEKFSATTNTSVEEYQKLDGVMKTMGWSMEDAAGDFAALSEKMMEAATTGEGEAFEMFQKLGVAVEDSSGKLRNTGDVFNDMIMGLQNVEDATERQAIASIMLGTTSEELAPLLKMTNEEFTAMKDNVNVIDEDNINKTLEFKKSWDTLKQTFSTVVIELGTSLMPLFQSLAEWVVTYMPEIQAVISKAFEIVSQVIDVAVNSIQTLITWFKNIVESANTTGTETNAIWVGIKSVFKTTFDNIIALVQAFIKMFQSFWENWGDTIMILVKGVWENIKIVFGTVFKVITDLLEIFTSLFSGDWQGFLEGIAKLVDDIWNGICDLWANMLDTLIELLKNIVPKMLEAGKNMMNGLWDGIKGVWSNISNWVGEKVEWLADKLTFWDNGTKKMNDSTSVSVRDGSHANGLSYVPWDGYMMEAHLGERLLTAEENVEYTKMKNERNTTKVTVDNKETNELLRQLIKKLDSLPKSMRNEKLFA